MKRHSIITIALITLTSAMNADIIYLLKGEEYEGMVQKITQDTVWFKVNRTVKKIGLEDVRKIEFEELHSAYKVKDLNDRSLNSLIKQGISSKDYPDAHSVTLYEKVVYKINSDSTWSKSIRKIEKLLQPGGRWIASKSFQYLKNSEMLDIKVARTIQPDGKIEWLKQNARKDESVYATYPMYDNLHQVRIALPDVKIGGVVEVQVEQTFPRISVEYPFLIKELFMDNEPIEYKEVEVICPPGVVFAMSHDSGIVKEKSVKKGWSTYRFTVRKSKEIVDEYLLPPVSDIAPKLMISFREDWNKLGTEYYKLLCEKMVCSKELSKKAKDLKTPEKIYNFVAKEIKALSIRQLSDYSWSPNSPDSIFSNKAGSFPDRVFLLYTMLKEAGFSETELLMVPDFWSGKRDNSVPTIAQFPSFIIRLNDSWLCPINDRVSFGELPDEYQNVIGLRLGDHTSEIVNIPGFEPEKEAMRDSLRIKLSTDGTMIVKERIRVCGNMAQGFRSNKNLKEEELKQSFERKVASVCQGAELVSFKVSDLEDLSEPVWYELQYKLPGYALSAGNLLMFKLPGIVYSAIEVGKPTRDNPMVFGIKTLRSVWIEIECPSKYSAYYIPRDYSYHSEIANYEAKFSEKEVSGLEKFFGGRNKVIFSDKYWLSISEAGREKYPEYKKCIETRAKLAQEWLALKKK